MKLVPFIKGYIFLVSYVSNQLHIIITVHFDRWKSFSLFKSVSIGRNFNGIQTLMTSFTFELVSLWWYEFEWRSMTQILWKWNFIIICTLRQNIILQHFSINFSSLEISQQSLSQHEKYQCYCNIKQQHWRRIKVII